MNYATPVNCILIDEAADNHPDRFRNPAEVNPHCIDILVNERYKHSQSKGDVVTGIKSVPESRSHEYGDVLQ